MSRTRTVARRASAFTAAAPAADRRLGLRGGPLSRGPASSEVGGGLRDSRDAVASEQLPGDLRGRLEQVSGFDLSRVRVHPRSAVPGRMAAHAVTYGSHIYLAPGQERQLPHEAWHTVQQLRGSVRATDRVAGHAVNRDERLEHEADRMGDRAARGGTSAAAVQADASMGTKGRNAAPSAPQPIVQGQFWARYAAQYGARHVGGLLGAMYTAFVARNLHRQRAIQQNPEAYQSRGRLDASHYLSGFPEGTLGNVMHGPVSTAHALFGDVGSSDIGAHYRENASRLSQPPTDENISALARGETQYWRGQQQWLPWLMGHGLSANGRARVLHLSRWAGSQ